MSFFNQVFIQGQENINADNIGNLTNAQTVNKNNLVSIINEVDTESVKNNATEITLFNNKLKLTRDEVLNVINIETI